MKIAILNKDGKLIEKENTEELFLVENAEKNWVYKVKKEDSLQTLISRFGDKNYGTLYEGKLLFITKNKSIIYVVKPLDTLSKICDKFHVSANSIREENNLKTDKLFIGQKLSIFVE